MSQLATKTINKSPSPPQGWGYGGDRAERPAPPEGNEMGKGRNRHRRRDEIARRSLPPSHNFLAQYTHFRYPKDNKNEDRWTTDQADYDRSARSERSRRSKQVHISRQKAQLLHPSRNQRWLDYPTAETQTFTIAAEPTLCERRQTREEVLHALNKTGRSGQKRPIWNLNSRKRCK